MSKVGLIFAGIGFYGASAYAAFGLAKILKEPTPNSRISDPAYQRELRLGIDLSQYTALASSYDSMVSYHEFLMLLGKRRKSLTARAKGDVLEISAGTGRNLEFYPDSIHSLTLCDKNEPMLRKAWERKSPLQPTFSVQNCENMSYHDDSFDTVIDTFGICSAEDPVQLVAEMGRVCKPDGEVLLLQHGRAHGYFKNWIDEILDKSSIKHAMNWGCWYNRNIDAIVKQAGLTIVEYKRFNFGTTYYIVAKPLKAKSS